MARTIAIVEDEPAIAANYRDAFERYGFSVRCYSDRESAMAGFRLALPDLAVIDVGLGDEMEGGFDLCRELRSMAPQLPIVFLTARGDELDVISGLRLGADDYLTKDISIAHMMARVHALLRRMERISQPQAEADETLERGDLAINVDRMLVTWKGQPLDLTVTEFWIVHCLAHYPGQVRNRQQLMDAARTVLDNNTITSHIKRIRRKFQSLDDGFNEIETAYGMGYRWSSRTG
ncbi:proteobacterial dedicated sortase system response regulator [Parendozoicomonas haliclonae]|nr:proteobacterial dedicated sortase system response regulator [Parendozoicomonas haliclonae]